MTTTSTTGALGLRLLTPFVLLLTVGCKRAVPADPGVNARLRGGDAWVLTGETPSDAAMSEAARDAGARDIYLRKCSQCHEPFHPTHLPPAGWPAAVAKYGPRAGLFGAERTRVLNWLMANAR